MWTKLMVRLWALKHERAYRNYVRHAFGKVVCFAMIFAAAFVLVWEYEFISRGGKVSWVAIPAALVLVMLAIPSAVVLIKEKRSKK